jgi:hypothetical protein
MTEQTSISRKRRLARSLGWILKTTFFLLIIMAFIFAFTGGSALGLTELQRSFASLETKVSANEANLNSLREFVNAEFERGDPEQQVAIDGLRRDVDGLDNELTAVQEQLAADIARQSEQLTALETALTTAQTTAATQGAAIATQEDALQALQGDSIAHGLLLDGLGGDMDALRLDLTAVNDNVTLTATEVLTLTAVANQQRQQTSELLTLFRVWEMITRARLRLLENNIGLAQTDLQTALLLIESVRLQQLAVADTAVLTQTAVLTPTNTISPNDPYLPLQTRLALAAANLPANPTIAVSDLELAWSELDTLLATHLSE